MSTPSRPQPNEVTDLHFHEQQQPEQQPAEDHPPTVSFIKPPVKDDAVTVTSLGEVKTDPEPSDPYGKTLTGTGERKILKTQDGKNDPTSPDMPALKGIPFVPGFDIFQEIGRGGMGVVYKAREYTLNRIVALKMVIVERHPSAEELIRFRLEAEVAARIRHPNVVQVFESGAVQSYPYLVMEWIEGGTLSDVLKQARLLPPLVAARLTSILARAVQHAHANGVIHRDLKPGNILLAKSEAITSASSRTTHPHAAGGASVMMRVKGENVIYTPKVTDFGLAKLTAGDMGLTETGRVMGTPEFMSPEQAAGKIREIGPASDIHALGVMLYQMLVGHTPFRGESTYAVVKKVIEDEAKSIREVSAVSQTPFDLETVCMKCLRKNPADRYATAAELADDLDAILSGRPISARPVSKLERTWKLIKRNPALATLAASLFITVTAGLIGVTWQWRNTVVERNRAILAEREAVRQQKTSEAVNRFLVSDMIAAAAPDRAQGRMVTVQDALDEAALRLPFAFADQPEIEAGVQSTVGESYRKLGKPAIAEPLLRKAFNTRINSLGAEHRDTLKTAKELALTLDDAGKWNQAEKILRDSTDHAEKQFGKNSPLALELRAALGLSLQVHGKSDEALSILTDVVDSRLAISGEENADTLRAMNDLGLVSYYSKNIPEAVKWITRALTGREKILSRTHPDTLESANNLAVVKEAEGKLDEAAKLLEDLIDRSRQVRGENHIDTLSAINNYGRMLYRQKRYGEAFQKYQEAIDGAVKSPGIGLVHPITLKFRHNLGLAQFALRQYAAADQTISTVLKLQKEILPANHQETLQTSHDLGTLRTLTGQADLAIDLLSETFHGRKQTFNLEHADTIQTAASWGRAIIASGRVDAKLNEAKTAIQSVIAAANSKSAAITNLEAIEKQIIGRETKYQAYQKKIEEHAKQPAEQFQVALDTANDWVRANDIVTAIAPATDAIQFAKQLPEKERQPRLSQAWLLTGQCMMSVGKFGLAQNVFQEHYDHIMATAPQSYDAGIAANLLGRSFLEQKQFEKAEPLLIDGFNLIRTHRKPDLAEAAWKDRAMKAKADIEKLYMTLGKADEVKKWREKNP